MVRQSEVKMLKHPCNEIEGGENFTGGPRIFFLK